MAGRSVTVTAGPARGSPSVRIELLSITFVSDHQDGGKKLLKRGQVKHLQVKVDRPRHDLSTPARYDIVPYDSDLGDDTTDFLKPEWDVTRGGDADSHPISQTRGTSLIMEAKIKFRISSKTRVTLTDLAATALPKVDFALKPNQKIRDGQVVKFRMTSKIPLPDNVDYLNLKFAWFAITDVGGFVPFANTGPHRIYVTLATPSGSMECPVDNTFRESGTPQVVTESRLAYAIKAARGQGTAGAPSRDKECADAIFLQMSADGVGYYLERRYENLADHTGVSPKPTLHHFLWLCLRYRSSHVVAECHNIGAAFVMACRILGVQGTFEVGYMYPWSRRTDVPPDFPYRAPPVYLGKYNDRCIRSHEVPGSVYEVREIGTDPVLVSHTSAQEALLFLDGKKMANNFEGVAKFGFTETGSAGARQALYAIGDAIFDKHAVDHDNASDYFASRGDTDSSGHPTRVDRTRGLFDLQFYRTTNVFGDRRCLKPYPFSNVTSTFRWER